MSKTRTEMRAAVSGSFHRHMEAITRAVHDLAALRVRVLSPADPRVVAAQGEFLFVASDRVRSIRLVQDRHVDCIRAADFLWLVCPDGYVGVSAAMEVQAATDVGVPVFATRAPNDLTVREYVTVVPSLSDALRRVETSPSHSRAASLLIDPNASLEEAHRVLEQMRRTLTKSNSLGDPAPRLYGQLSELQGIVGRGVLSCN